METKNNYKSFNENKSIDELKYTMLIYKARLEEEIIEYKFYKNLLEQSIFKDNTVNLFENLETFKKEIATAENEAVTLLKEVKLQANSIVNKIECNDLFCDNFFIKNYDQLEEQLYTFFNKCTHFKIHLFEYLESVMKS